ncbi:MAG: hypothetical protein M3157_02350, partial [Actinomycetota bacterium]|nr:hypothetical protein [Actinomycetota bacterium]
MPGNPVLYAVVSLAAALVPAAIGFYAWRRCGRPAIRTLAVLMWVLALWSVVYALELLSRALLLHQAEQAVLLAVAPLWLVFALQYTGRGGQVTRRRLALLFAVPLVTLALILTSGWHDLLWSPEQPVGPLQPPAIDNYGPWFWIDFGYRALLVFLGSAFLVPMVVDGRGVYRTQSLCLLAGFLTPWAADATYRLGAGSVPNLASLAFVVTGLA